MIPTSFDYFLFFLRKKIRDGEKQIDIANSGLVQRSSAYIHKLYKGEPKSCPIETQRNIAAYFKVSYDEMIKKGKILYIKKNPHVIEDKATKGKGEIDLIDPKDLLSHLNIVANGIKKNQELLIKLKRKAAKIEELIEEIDLYKSIFETLYEGVTFFNEKREFVFSSNRWGFLDDVDITKSPSIDTVVLAIRKKIKNLDEVLDNIFLVSEKKKESEIDVIFHSGEIYNFKIKPLFRDGKFLGTLLINTLKYTIDNKD